MEVNAYIIRRKIDEEISNIASLMMNGAASWDDYNRLVGQASALFRAANIVKEQEIKVSDSNADLFSSGHSLQDGRPQ
jgi:hypothetical protein